MSFCNTVTFCGGGSVMPIGTGMQCSVPISNPSRLDVNGAGLLGLGFGGLSAGIPCKIGLGS